MKAIIMAGGMGTRLRPISGDKPKPMVPLLGKPIMEHILMQLRQNGFDDICAALKYRAGDIIAHFGDGEKFGVRMQYRIEEEPLGTAGGVKNCADFYGDEDFLVISGDAACDFELARLMAAHKNSGAAATIALCRNSNPLRYGLAVQDMEGWVRAFIEKPDWPRVVTDMVNTGIYVLSPRVMELVPEGREYDFGRELFPELLRRGEKILGLEMEGYWCDIGTPASYFRCCADAVEGRLKIELPEEFEQAAPSQSASPWCEPSGLEELCPCSDRAGIMGILASELMELGADYSDGLCLYGQDFEMHIRPAAERSALRIGINCADMEVARDMMELAREMVEKLESPRPAGTPL